jgi:hypothetical protein
MRNKSEKEGKKIAAILGCSEVQYQNENKKSHVSYAALNRS